MKTHVMRCTLLAVLGLGSGAGSAAAQPASTVIPVDGGMTPLRLNDRNIDKDKEVVALRARRDNFNAHGFDVVSFYLVGKHSAGKREFDIIPIFTEGRKGRDERRDITVGGGADGNLDDFRVLAAQGKQPARLVLAHREFGASYAAPGIVHFTYYELTRNDMETPGEPALYFKQKSQANSRQKYVDVNDAFDRELHMGDAGGRANEPRVSD